MASRLAGAAPRAQVAVVDARADARFGIASSLLDPMTPVLAEVLNLGPGGAAELGTDVAAVAARRWHAAIVDALELAQVPFAIVEEATPDDELAGYRAVIAPTPGRIDRALYQRLRGLAEARRTIVVLGPELPTRDELDQPLTDPGSGPLHSLAPPRRIGRLKPGSLADLPGLAEDLAALAGELPLAWTIERPDQARAFAYADPAGRTRVVFVVSDAAKPVNAVLLVEPTTRGLRDPFAVERPRIVAGKATIAVPARGIRMLIVD